MNVLEGIEQPMAEAPPKVTTFSRHDDLDGYLASLDPAVLDHINRRWQGEFGKEGAGWMPHEYGQSQTHAGVDFAYQCLKWAMTNGYVSEADAPTFRNAVMQWLHEKQGMNMGYGKKHMPSRFRRR